MKTKILITVCLVCSVYSVRSQNSPFSILSWLSPSDTLAFQLVDSCQVDSKPDYYVHEQCAKAYIRSYGEKVGYNSPIHTICEHPKYWKVERDKLHALSQFDSVHVYIGLRDSGRAHLFFVGVNGGQEDMQGIINLIEPCPHDCGQGHPALSHSYCDGLKTGMNGKAFGGTRSVSSSEIQVPSCVNCP